jgi:ribosomal protein S18 acetylase RimI-like enzyme
VSVGVTVRRAQVGDIPQLVELNALVQAAHVAAEPAVFKPTLPAGVAAWFATGLDSGSLRAWVAVDGEALDGYVTVLTQERDEHVFCYARAWWEVDQLGVRPESRRRGVARALLQAVAAEAEEAGVVQLQLSTWSFNAGAQAAWRHLGFEPQVTRFAIDPRQLRV